MNHLRSDMSQSENKREGLKQITQAVHQILKENKSCTYSFICKNISFQNVETLNRRIYDVLNVMKAVKLINKRGKKYFLINNQDDIARKKDEINKLKEMKEVFQFIVDRNSRACDVNNERLYLPFMVSSTAKTSEIHCETNEERSFFIFRSSKPLKINEDLDILKEIYALSQSRQKTTHNFPLRNIKESTDCENTSYLGGHDLEMDSFFF